MEVGVEERRRCYASTIAHDYIVLTTLASSTSSSSSWSSLSSSSSFSSYSSSSSHLRATAAAKHEKEIILHEAQLWKLKTPAADDLSGRKLTLDVSSDAFELLPHYGSRPLIIQDVTTGPLARPFTCTAHSFACSALLA